MNDVNDQGQRISIDCRVDDSTTTGFCTRRDFTARERTIRAARTFGVLFGVACFSVFIPLLHFVLPPIFLIVGITLAVFAWLETAEVLTGEVSCPNCRKVVALVREAEEWPKVLRCPGCSFSLTLSPATEA